MAKDPAFLFYSQDWLVGTNTMTFEDKGRYITILCQMHQEGRLSEETIRFLVGSISDKLKSKFSIDENGMWFNIRLEAESEKRANFTKTRRENGKQGGRPPKSEPDGKPKENHMVMHVDNHMGNHMGNENVNEDVNINNGENPFFKLRKTIPPTLQMLDEYTRWYLAKNPNKSFDGVNKFLDFYNSKGWKVGSQKMQDWQAAVRNWMKEKEKVEEKKFWY